LCLSVGYYAPIKAPVRTHHELHWACSSTCPMDFDQVGHNLPDMTEIGTAHQDLGSYCSSDWQVGN
jgi:hypothetical protein